jgi:hypothetical protein
MSEMDESERILCSAVWYDNVPLEREEVLRMRGFSPYNVDSGIVFCGWRHANCIYQAVAIFGKTSDDLGEVEQGFLTNKNRFVGREEAGLIAFAAGQTDELKTFLFSEDVW